MLLKVLNFIYNNKIFSSKVIGKELGLSSEMVESLKKKLEELELIKKKESCEKGNCNKCTCGCSNTSLNNTVNWIITEKGLRFLKNKKEV